MKKIVLLAAIVLVMASAVPGHAFLDYLFSGGSSRDAIDNSALGDLRAWYTGNPAYQFNPWYSGPSAPNQPASGGQAPGAQGSYSVGGPQTAPQQYQQPGGSYYPSQAPQGYGQYQQMQPGGGSYGPQAGPQYQPDAQQYQAGPQQQYQAMPQQYQAPPAQQYQAMPQQYQAPSQPYQAMPQQYQAAPQQYQAMPQQYQQPMPQQYQAGPQSYQGYGQ
jgi:hypothetical protein